MFSILKITSHKLSASQICRNCASKKLLHSTCHYERLRTKKKKHLPWTTTYQTHSNTSFNAFHLTNLAKSTACSFVFNIYSTASQLVACIELAGALGFYDHCRCKLVPTCGSIGVQREMTAEYGMLGLWLVKWQNAKKQSHQEASSCKVSSTAAALGVNWCCGIYWHCLSLCVVAAPCCTSDLLNFWGTTEFAATSISMVGFGGPSASGDGPAGTSRVSNT